MILFSDIKWLFSKNKLRSELMRVSSEREYFSLKLGLLWPTLEFLLFSSVFAIVFTRMLGVEVSVYLPHVMLGLATWNYMTEVIISSSGKIISYSPIIKEFPLPPILFFHVPNQMAFRTFSLSVFLATIISLVLSGNTNLNFFLAIPGIVILYLSVYFASISLGFITLQFRDMSFVLRLIVRVSFFLTPIMWLPQARGSLMIFTRYNIFYHLIEIVRAPLQGNLPSMLNYAVAISFLLISAVIALIVYNRSKPKYVHWL